jgi:hypothetical protein
MTLQDIKPKLDSFVNLLNVSKMLIPADKAPKLLHLAELTGALVQTNEFQQVAVFTVNTVEELVTHFVRKAKV